MPTYTFLCNRCDYSFEIFMSINNYQPKQKCPICNKSNQVNRNYATDNPSGHIEIRTLGALADRNAERMSEDEKEALFLKHNDYRFGPKPDLPDGMHRIDIEPKYNKTRNKPRRQLRKKR